MNATTITRTDAWRPAFLAGIFLALSFVLCGFLFESWHSHESEYAITLAVPFLFGFPLGWKTDAPDVACIGLAAGFVAPTLLWSIISHAGDDLGPVIATLILSLIIAPTAGFGIGLATIIKSICRDGFNWPTRSGYLLIAFMLLPLFLVKPLTERMHPPPQKIQPVFATEAQLEMTEQTRPPAKVVDSRASAQHYLRGVVEFERQNFKRAAKEWETALELDPDNRDAQNGLARLGMYKRK